MIVLLGNGHGALINGKYQTAGKRKDWLDKGIIYEGEFNRAIVNDIIEQLTYYKIPYVNIAMLVVEKEVRFSHLQAILRVTK